MELILAFQGLEYFCLLLHDEFLAKCDDWRVMELTICSCGTCLQAAATR